MVEPFNDNAPDATTNVDVTFEHESVREAFSQLSDGDRELLELRVVAGLSSEEVATILSMRPSAVRMAQMRALEKLRVLMAEVSVNG